MRFEFDFLFFHIVLFPAEARRAGSRKRNQAWKNEAIIACVAAGGGDGGWEWREGNAFHAPSSKSYIAEQEVDGSEVPVI